MGRHDCQDLVRIPGEEISNCVGAFDHEGAFLCSHTSIEEKFADVRPLRARQEGK